MELLLLLVVLKACAAAPQDLSGKMFIFPQLSSTAHVRLIASTQRFGALTVCHRSFTDFKRDHALFSLATPSSSNDFLIFWDEAKKQMTAFVKNEFTIYKGWDYNSNMWHSICTTWDSESGLVQLWFDGQPTMKKYISSGSNISGSTIIILGQEQDTHGGGFDSKQCFIGMMSDVHMWDHTLSPCEIQKYVDGLNFTPGNVLSWSALEFQITGRVLIEDKPKTCD
ncbi:C-reactive protein-like [Anarhichas minor]|uniref:C-reactive protein-like n=1 Tax=Anarhichas minor TaxID=65739 RepID=UPI003F7356A1